MLMGSKQQLRLAGSGWFSRRLKRMISELHKLQRRQRESAWQSMRLRELLPPSSVTFAYQEAAFFIRHTPQIETQETQRRGSWRC